MVLFFKKSKKGNMTTYIFLSPKMFLQKLKNQNQKSIKIEIENCLSFSGPPPLVVPTYGTANHLVLASSGGG